jgi:selenocysteine lyase/cysteine desulfurase
MEHFNITGTLRASMVFYNTFEEVERLTEALVKAKTMLS